MWVEQQETALLGMLTILTIPPIFGEQGVCYGLLGWCISSRITKVFETADPSTCDSCRRCLDALEGWLCLHFAPGHAFPGWKLRNLDEKGPTFWADLL